MLQGVGGKRWGGVCVVAAAGVLACAGSGAQTSLRSVPAAGAASAPGMGYQLVQPAAPMIPLPAAQAAASNCEPGPGGSVTVRIGHVAPMTGVLAHLGRDNENGAILAVEDLNAQCLLIGSKRAQFELVARDDGGDPQTGTRVALSLVVAGVNGVVGHLNSGSTIPAAKIYRDAGIVQISPSATNPRYTRLGYATAFRVIAHDERLGRVLGRYAVEVAKGRRIAIVDDRTAYGGGIADAFEAGVLQAGGTVLRRDRVMDYSTEFGELVAKLRASKPDLVFYGGMDAVAGPLLRQIRQAGMTSMFMGGDGICTNGLPRLAGAEAVLNTVLCGEGGGIDEEYLPALRALNDRFTRRFGMPMQLYAPYVYDAVQVMAQAMQNAGSADPARYLPALKAISFTGVMGAISFDERGDLRDGAITLYAFGSTRRVQVAVLH
jgi:branched-chain amino acid transport system substrate-binding protein